MRKGVNDKYFGLNKTPLSAASPPNGGERKKQCYARTVYTRMSARDCSLQMSKSASTITERAEIAVGILPVCASRELLDLCAYTRCISFPTMTTVQSGEDTERKENRNGQGNDSLLLHKESNLYL